MSDLEIPPLVNEVQKIIDAYAEKTGINKFAECQPPESLYMSVEKLKKLPPEDLSDACYQISQYALYIHRSLNENRAWARWAKSKLEEVAAAALSEVSSRFGGYEKTMIARHNPELAKKLNVVIRQAELKIELLYGIPEQLKIMLDTIRDIKFVALKREKEYSG